MDARWWPWSPRRRGVGLALNERAGTMGVAYGDAFVRVALLLTAGVSPSSPRPSSMPRKVAWHAAVAVKLPNWSPGPGQTHMYTYVSNSQPMHMRSRRELWKGKQQTRLHWLTALRTQQSSLVLTVPHPTSLLPQRAT